MKVPTKSCQTSMLTRTDWSFPGFYLSFLHIQSQPFLQQWLYPANSATSITCVAAASSLWGNQMWHSETSDGQHLLWILGWTRYRYTWFLTCEPRNWLRAKELSDSRAFAVSQNNRPRLKNIEILDGSSVKNYLKIKLTDLGKFVCSCLI